jgi:PLP dependent protein
MSVDTIRDRYESVIERIVHSARSVGRDPNNIRLVVVTKLQPVATIQEVIAAGAHYLGENYADEAIEKKMALPPSDVQWHIIGHVQSRKARLVCEHFDYLHSLDSLKLAEKLNKICVEFSRTLPVLLEVNVSGEESKSGWPAWDEAKWTSLVPDIASIITLSNVKVRGLMTMAPFFENPEDARPYFHRLRKLQRYLASQFLHAEWDELSMGMSGDFEVAVQEGATWVRVGQAILGPRPG